MMKIIMSTTHTLWKIEIRHN